MRPLLGRTLEIQAVFVQHIAWDVLSSIRNCEVKKTVIADSTRAPLSLLVWGLLLSDVIHLCPRRNQACLLDITFSCTNAPRHTQFKYHSNKLHPRHQVTRKPRLRLPFPETVYLSAIAAAVQRASRAEDLLHAHAVARITCRFQSQHRSKPQRKSL